MKRELLPANLTLMDLTGNRLSAVRPVTSLDITEGNTDAYHPEGLFSTLIFGRMGSPDRDLRFSYINIKTSILHPLIYKNLIKLKGLYGGILTGRAFAIWDDIEKDFMPSDALQGQTGYYFFMQYWKQIVFKETGSDIRSQRLRFVMKFRDRAEVDKILVLPAGLRDVQIDENGRVEQGEINDMYRRLLNASNTLSASQDNNSPVLDTNRLALQTTFNAIFDYLKGLLDGKDGFIQKKWASRRLFNGTRNVITSMDTSSPVLGLPNSPKHNNTVVGIYQMAKSCQPVTRFELANGWLSYVFGGFENSANLVNAKTLKRERVRVSPDLIDRWTKTDGLDKVITSLSEPELRHRPIKIGDYYLGLIYIGPEMTYRIFGDIDELPENLDRKNVHPLTLAQLIYVSCHLRWRKLAMYVTRYPVAGDGSIYPSILYCKTTITGECRRELNDSWEQVPEEEAAWEFPKFGDVTYVESMLPHASRVGGLSADYDGDMCSGNTVYTVNAVKEVEDFLNSTRAYLAGDGSFRASPMVETVEYVIYNLTGA